MFCHWLVNFSLKEVETAQSPPNSPETMVVDAICDLIAKEFQKQMDATEKCLVDFCTKIKYMNKNLLTNVVMNCAATGFKTQISSSVFKSKVDPSHVFGIKTRFVRSKKMCMPVSHCLHWSFCEIYWQSIKHNQTNPLSNCMSRLTQASLC